MASRLGRLAQLASRLASHGTASTASAGDRIIMAGVRIPAIQQAAPAWRNLSGIRGGLLAEPRVLCAGARSFQTKPSFSGAAAATQPDDDASVVETTMAMRTTVPENQGNQLDQEVSVFTLAGEATGKTVTLSGDVFDVGIRVDIVQRVVRWQLAKRQQGTHKTKDRSEVSGSGKKPHQQKGSGMARAGTKRAPQHRGGGRAHGKVVRSHEIGLQRKVRRLGLKCALSAKLAEGNLVIVDSADAGAPKTQALLEKLEAMAAARGADKKDKLSFLLVDGAGAQREPAGELLRRAACNLRPRVDVLASDGLNVYDILRKRVVLLSADAAREVQERLSAPMKR